MRTRRTVLFVAVGIVAGGALSPAHAQRVTPARFSAEATSCGSARGDAAPGLCAGYVAVRSGDPRGPVDADSVSSPFSAAVWLGALGSAVGGVALTAVSWSATGSNGEDLSPAVPLLALAGSGVGAGSGVCLVYHERIPCGRIYAAAMLGAPVALLPAALVARGNAVPFFGMYLLVHALITAEAARLTDRRAQRRRSGTTTS